jgi:polyisoprenoid-binding protein YceI
MVTFARFVVSSLLVAIAALWSPAWGSPMTFAINSTGGSRVTFESDAPVENIVGVTTSVSGSFTTDFDEPKKSRANVVVDLTTVKTGIDKRDAHMRSPDFLDTKKHPNATFNLTKIDIKGDPRANGGAKAVGTGSLTIKGVQREIQVPVKVAFRALDDQLKKLGFNGDVLRVTGDFDIQLSDYGIKVPGMLGQKVSNTIKLAVALTAVAK